MKKDIFLVDIDDTLLDFHMAERENLSFALSSLSLPFGEEIYRFFHETNDALWKALERGEVTRENLKVERFRLLCEKFSLRADARELSKIYVDHFPKVCVPFVGAAGFLKELQTRGRVFLVTNGGKKIQTEHIRLANISPYIEDVFISEEIGFDKPSLEFANYVEGHIENYLRERAVWIGDSLTSDGLCAKNRGIDFILFAPRGVPAGYEGLFAKTYSEVLSLLS